MVKDSEILSTEEQLEFRKLLWSQNFYYDGGVSLKKRHVLVVLLCFISQCMHVCKLMYPVK